METWESVFLYEEPRRPEAPAATMASPAASPPLIWSPMTGISEGMRKTAKASIERGKAMYVDLPCFTC